MAEACVDKDILLEDIEELFNEETTVNKKIVFEYNGEELKLLFQRAYLKGHQAGIDAMDPNFPYGPLDV